MANENQNIIGAGQDTARPAPKKILDACCGGRMFWWNKDNPDAWFIDCREVPKGAFQNNWNPNWCVSPDEIVDFRALPYQSNSFNMVVFDPPHLTSGSMKSVINKKYGLLNKQTWKQDVVDGFRECWRVLAVNGVLIFKWNEANIKAKELLREFGVEPLFGDFTGKTGATIWVTFFKTEESPVLGEEGPAQNTMEICHTAPNSGRDAIPLDIFEGVL